MRIVDRAFTSTLNNRATGCYPGALPTSMLARAGFGETYKQARANAVAFEAALGNNFSPLRNWNHPTRKG